jgi:DNA-binding CsgD family transcriptional regulator
VHFALDDAVLMAALIAGGVALVSREEAELTVAGTDGAGVVVTGPRGETAELETRDPALIGAAVALLRAGYTVRHAPPPSAPLVPPIHLSPREQQVAALLLDGASNKAFARALDISVHTAKFHVTAVQDKLGARNRVDAVSIILREGLIAF